MKKHYNIPIFVPEAACPHQCIFCNQKNITEKSVQPSVEEVLSTVESYLKTIPPDSDVEIAFFGGNFTGLPEKKQKEYLQAVQGHIREGKVQGLRCSTRPDYINEKSIELLQEYNVKMIELGVQSFDDEVLKQSGRGHTAEDTYRAVEVLKKYKIPFGLQMMTGLPGDSPEKSIKTAQEIIRMKACNTRIYPCLVIRNTVLEQLYKAKKYSPQHMDDAVSLCSDLMLLFEQHHVKVLRVGLHRSEGFDSGNTLIAGPYHPSFKELVETGIWKGILKEKIEFSRGKKIEIFIPKGTSGMVAGHCGSNRKWLEQHFKNVRFIETNSLRNRDLHADYS